MISRTCRYGSPSSGWYSSDHDRWPLARDRKHSFPVGQVGLTPAPSWPDPSTRMRFGSDRLGSRETLPVPNFLGLTAIEDLDTSVWFARLTVVRLICRTRPRQFPTKHRRSIAVLSNLSLIYKLYVAISNLSIADPDLALREPCFVALSCPSSTWRSNPCSAIGSLARARSGL